MMGSSFNDKAIEVSLCRGTSRKSHNTPFKNTFPNIHTHLLSRIKTKAILACHFTFYMLQNYIKLCQDVLSSCKSFYQKVRKPDGRI